MLMKKGSIPHLSSILHRPALKTLQNGHGRFHSLIKLSVCRLAPAASKNLYYFRDRLYDTLSSYGVHLMQQRRRIRTWIRGLDERMQGGIPQGHIVLVCGTSGSMKSSISFHLVYNNVKHGNMQGVYLSLEQGRASLLRHMAGLGIQPHIVEMVLNHSTREIRGVAQTYNRHSYLEEKRAALTAWANHFEAHMTGLIRENVVALHG